MATTRNPLELATNVLLHLNIVAAEETPAPSDSNYVIKRYHDLFEEMGSNDETYWEVEAIPAAIVEPLTQMVALLVMPAFGKPVDAVSMDEGLRVLRRRLRRTVNVRSAETATHFEDF